MLSVIFPKIALSPEQSLQCNFKVDSVHFQVRVNAGGGGGGGGGGSFGMLGKKALHL